jgi:hypothetical protein
MQKVKGVMITRPDGTEIEYASQSAAARGEGMTQSPVSEMCRGVKKHHRGYKARWIESADDGQPVGQAHDHAAEHQTEDCHGHPV